MEQRPEGKHGHDIVPMERATGRRIDITRMDLGHPDVPDLWDRLHGRCKVGVLVCAACAETSHRRYLYLQLRNDRPVICHYTYAQVREAGLAESDEHHALKDKVCELAEREGLTADQEVAGPGRRRQTDVVVSGGTKAVGWEVQLSGIPRQTLRKRIRTAAGDGLVPSWLTMRGSPAFTDLIDRAPACSAKTMVTLEIATADDIRVFQGLKNLEIVPCTFHRGEQWHRGLTCTGYHARPAPLEETRHPTLRRMISLTASGDVVPIEWPRKVTGYNRPWLWVPKEDAERFYNVERPCLEKAGMAPPAPEHVAVGFSAGWHVSEGYGLADILGDVCQYCRWTRKEHHWHCSTGLSRHREPRFG